MYLVKWLWWYAFMYLSFYIQNCIFILHIMMYLSYHPLPHLHKFFIPPHLTSDNHYMISHYCELYPFFWSPGNLCHLDFPTSLSEFQNQTCLENLELVLIDELQELLDRENWTSLLASIFGNNFSSQLACICFFLFNCRSLTKNNEPRICSTKLTSN